MQLSKNLSLGEVTKSNTATRRGIDNNPNELQLKALKDIATAIFQPIRDHFGKPIYVSSGFRSPALNKAIGGSSKSQHCSGEALDLDMDGRDGPTNREIFDFIRKNLFFDQLIWEFGDDYNPNWVHVSYSEGNNRGKILVAYKEGGRTKYKTFD
jgi:hypothetical protein